MKPQTKKKPRWAFRYLRMLLGIKAITGLLWYCSFSACGNTDQPEKMCLFLQQWLTVTVVTSNFSLGFEAHSAFWHRGQSVRSRG